MARVVTLVGGVHGQTLDATPSPQREVRASAYRSVDDGGEALRAHTQKAVRVAGGDDSVNRDLAVNGVKNASSRVSKPSYSQAPYR